MIEVEIRGLLTKEKHQELEKFFHEKGEHIESHEREMILLTEYSGYTHNMTIVKWIYDSEIQMVDAR